jgi:UDP-galactopyranose mutase
MKAFLIIGSGFSGSVIAEQLSKVKSNKIVVLDERSHFGGNCYTERDVETGIMVHKYGPHIFNTDNLDIWNYIKQFTEMVPFINRVKTVHNGNVYSLPINLHTINQYFRKSFNPDQARSFIDSISDNSIVIPKNFEEQALKFVGKELYDAFLYGYTKKQWGVEPTQLPASILKRLPIRFSYNDNYYLNPFQGIPINGYTPIFEKLLDSSNIEVHLNCKFDRNFDISGFDHVFYTGPIDSFFDYEFGRLSYRTVFFEKKISLGDFQGNAVINYADLSIPYTRIHEHKHFTPWESHEKTVYFMEYSKETELTDIPFYPKRLDADMETLKKYQSNCNSLKNHTFVGRLATYRYMDMHHVIKDAIDAAQNHL